MTTMFVMPLEAAPAAGGGSNFTFLIMMAVIFVVMYLFMIRPQQKRQKELVNFRNSLQKGDHILTAGGIYGKVKEVNDTTVVIEVANDVNIKMDKSMIMRDPSNTPAK